MFTLKPLPAFLARLGSIRDPGVKGTLVARLKRLERGVPGDVAPVGNGSSEMRIHVGAGWRIYYIQRAGDITVLLAGGAKQTQKADIKRAKALAALLD